MEFKIVGLSQLYSIFSETEDKRIIVKVSGHIYFKSLYDLLGNLGYIWGGTRTRVHLDNKYRPNFIVIYTEGREVFTSGCLSGEYDEVYDFYLHRNLME